MRAKLSTLLTMTPAALLTLAGAPSVVLADDFFLKIDGIEGESNDAKHKNEIEIQSFTWGVSNSGTTAAGGGGGAGKTSFQDFAITTQLSKASPKLFLVCAAGQHIKSAQLTARRTGKEQQEYYTIKMEDVMVSHVQNSATGDQIPTDSVTLNFSKITWTYRPQKPDGSMDAPVTTYWDIKMNKGG